jgi:DnaJ-class molecular chaperone
MICRTCRGAGNIFTHPGEWWPCPACGGAGVRVMYGPAEFVLRAKKVRK